MKPTLIFIVAMLLCFFTAQAQIITTVAGTGTQGYSGDGGSALGAKLGTINLLALDAAGNLYLPEQSNYRVRKITPTGTITTVAGSGGYGSSGDGGSALAAKFTYVAGVTCDSAGNLYIADYLASKIRQVNAGTGMISTFAAATNPFGLCIPSGGYLYAAAPGINGVYKINLATGVKSIFAGGNGFGYSGDGGPATAAKFAYPRGICTDAKGNTYICDIYSHVVRRVDKNGNVSTFAGTTYPYYFYQSGGDGGQAASAFLAQPFGIAADATGNIYIADQFACNVRKVDTLGMITTVAGNGTTGYAGDGGNPAQAELSSPTGLAVDASGNLYIADQLNYVIRKVTFPPAIASYSPGTPEPGATITLTGLRFTGATGVSLGGTPATSFTVVSDSVLTAVLPAGVAGNVALNVTTPAGTGTITILLPCKPDSSTTTLALCQNQLPYTWNGKTYNAAGTYRDTLTNAGGCDSIATLVLTLTTPRLYVNKNVSGGTGDGSSWANAYKELGEALWTAQNSTCTSEIWVAKGTYLPTRDPFGNTSPADPRTKTFYTRNGLAIYGGFAGNETALAQRDYTNNITTLSGDFNGDDMVGGSGATLSIANNSENAYNVVLSVNDDSTTVLDGFTVTGGNANNSNLRDTVEGVAWNGGEGGGINALQSSLRVSNAVVTVNSGNQGVAITYYAITGNSIHLNNLNVAQNYSLKSAAVVLTNLNGGPAVVSNCNFNGNYSKSFSGSGLFCNSLSASISNSVFINNAGSEGGGLAFLGGSASVVNCVFSHNTAAVGGAAYCASVSATFTNCLVTGNTAKNAGGISFSQGTNATVGNCTVYGNQAGSLNGGIAFIGAAGSVTNSLVYGNTDKSASADSNGVFNSSIAFLVKVTNSLVQGGVFTPKVIDGGNNLSAYPLFKDTTNLIGPDGLWGTADDGLQLACGSPAVNAGVNDSVTVTTDITGRPRIFNGIVDMGAYELQAAADSSVTRVTVCPAALPYHWNGNSYAAAGTYRVHFTNATGCDSAAVLVLATDSLAPTFAPVTTTKACYGGFVYAVARGVNGIPPYNFSLNGGAPVKLPSYHIYNLTPGVYSETVTDSLGCSANAGTLTVVQPAAPVTLSVRDSAYSCTSTTSAIMANAAGGWGGYLYSLNNGTPQAGNAFVVNTAGTDSIRATDSIGCTVIQAIITGPLSATFAAAKTQTCFGTPVAGTAAAAGGVAPYQYSLNGGTNQSSPAFTLSSGPYIVTVTDAKGCSANSNTVTITQPAAPVGINISHTNVTCRGKADGTITAQGTGGYGNYMYSLNGGAYQTSGMLTGLPFETDYVRAKDMAGCTSANTQVVISEPLTPCPPVASLKVLQPALQLKVAAYPNPSNTAFALVTQGGDARFKVAVTVRDMYGNAVYQTMGTVFDTYRFGSNFTGGIYLAEVRNGNMVQTVKLVKGN